MLNVGLIGLGAEWEHGFAPALAELRRRLRVRCVYAPVATQAEQAAAELDCEIAAGMFALLERDDVRAVLVLDAAWYAGVPAQLACHLGKPAFIAAPLGPRLPLADTLLRRAAESGVTLMGDFRNRYTPATSRLRELMATRLGRATSIRIEPGSLGYFAVELSPEEAVRELLAKAIDWSTNLTGTAAVSVRAVPVLDAADASDVLLEFRRPAAGDEPATASIRIDRAAGSVRTTVPANGFIAPFRAEVRCANGTAVIEGPQRIRWEAEGELGSESLDSDRAAIQVMLD